MNADPAYSTIMIATRFSVATHIMLLMATEPVGRLTSPRIAVSVNTNPVVVRRIMRMLARAGLVHVRRGQGGASLGREASAISLDDVWCAVHPAPAPPLLPLHATPDPDCPVGGQVHWLFGEVFSGAETAMRVALAATSLADMKARLALGVDRQDGSSS
ncbi:MAG: Rrf2 family transcriptional regulator [Janthinobacterium lividum]